MLWVSLPPAQHLSSLSLHLSSEQTSRHSATAAKEITSSAVVATFLGITGAFHAGVCGFGEIETTKLEMQKPSTTLMLRHLSATFIINYCYTYVRTYVFERSTESAPLTIMLTINVLLREPLDVLIPVCNTRVPSCKGKWWCYLRPSSSTARRYTNVLQ